MVLALLGWSMPQFWLGLVLMLLFSIKLKVLPITGGTEWQRLILPALTLALGFAGIIARLVRTEILEELRKEYVRTARSKGLKESAVLIIHVLRNSMISVVTIIGLQFGRMLGGAVIVESVFARQGVGRMAIDALIDRDMPVVQGAVLFLALVFLLSNLLVDITYSLLDPRIRIQSE
jgi:peptide/nickel transport system permease protein